MDELKEFYTPEKLILWRENPLAFVEECFGSITPQQLEVLQTIVNIRRLTIKSKDNHIAAFLALWFIVTRQYAKVLIVAPTKIKLVNTFWSVFIEGFKKSGLQNEFVLAKDRFFHKNTPKEWWLRTVSTQSCTTQSEQIELLAGYTAEHLLVICIDAAEIPDPVFFPLESLIGDDNRVVLIE